MALDHNALGKLLAGRRVAAVSGTNGKTTTTHLLTAAVQASLADPREVVTNADGANLHHGIASALVTNPNAPIAVLETDERVVGSVIELGAPEVLVLLNFSRDQLDRHHEINALGRSWRRALAKAGDVGPVVVANACDPLVVWSAEPARRVIWVDTADPWTQDATLCPACGTVLVREGGRWACPTGDLAQPEADYVLDGEDVIDPVGQTWRLELQVPGRFNRANAACALAAARVMGVPPAMALAGMATVAAPAGRYAVANFGEAQGRLLLAKNPAGWAESLPLATTDPIVLPIDAAAADGRDLSWLWDVEFEQLAGRHVIATGPRAQDLAVRLDYAGVEFTVIHDLMAAFADPRVVAHADPVDVIATYTPFQKLRKLGGLA
ncbi:MurT ligase domain-containing protein [Propionibacteriaceae bacterium Y1923]|uniref:MurT ligase domain-containing protein n=1 Tax=Aestuariimicrobium sp. Y1814 TaxID=3418742 RepID=UPI003C1D413E